MTLTTLSLLAIDAEEMFRKRVNAIRSSKSSRNARILCQECANSEKALCKAVNSLLKARNVNREAVTVQWFPFQGTVILDNKGDHIDLRSLYARGVKA